MKAIIFKVLMFLLKSEMKRLRLEDQEPSPRYKKAFELAKEVSEYMEKNKLSH